MPDASGHVSRRNTRAGWVGIRTLRHVPRAVGETDAGDPVFEVRGVRLVLHGDAAHFSRLVPCSNCGRDVVGAAVLSSADLDHVPLTVICNECVRKVTGPQLGSGPRPGVDPAGRPAVELEAPRPPGQLGRGGRPVLLGALADAPGPASSEALEGRVRDAEAEVARLASESARLAQAHAEGQRALREALDGLDRPSAVPARWAGL